MKENRKNKIAFLAGMTALLAVLSVFIALRLRQPSAVPDADLDALAASLEAEGLTERTVRAGEAELKRNFGLLPSDCGEVVYYTATDFMDVDELLLVRFSEAAQADTVQKAAQARKEELLNRFRSYGTDQYGLMQEARIYRNGSYVVYAAGHHAEELMNRVKAMIER